jgi:membrane protein required for beta-lactamase induction
MRDRQFAILAGFIVAAVLAAALGIAFGAVFVAPVLFAAAIGLAGYGMSRVAAAIQADSDAQRRREEAADAAERAGRPNGEAERDPHRRAEPHRRRTSGPSRRR